MDLRPRGHGRREAELLRLLLRDVPRRDLREPFPASLPRDGARRPGRRERLRQPPDGEPARAVRRVRTRPGTLLPGLRRATRRSAASAARIRTAPSTTSSRPRISIRCPRAEATLGRSTATTLIAARTLAVYAKQLWPFLADALQQAHAGDGTGFGSSQTPSTAATPTAATAPARDRYFLITARRPGRCEPASTAGDHGDGGNPYIAAGNHSWGLFDHTLVERGLRRIELRALRPAARTTSSAARSRPRSPRQPCSRSQRRTTRRRRIAARSVPPRNSAT